MSTTVSLSIRKKKNDDLYRVVIQVIHNRKNSTIKTGIYVDHKSWDSSKLRIKSSCSLYDNVTQVNSVLSDQMKRTLDRILDLEKKGILNSLSLISLMNYLNPKRSGITIVDALRNQKKLLIESNRISVANNVTSAIKLLVNTNNEYLTFADLTNKKLEELALLHKAKNNGHGNGNGFKTYFAQIKKVYNDLLKENKISENSQLSKFTVRTKKTSKRSIAVCYFHKLIALDYKPGSHLYHCRNILIFMYLQGGINMIDLLTLKPGNIKNGRLIYFRRKTGKLYDMPLAKRCTEIINEYLIGKQPDDYIFPILNKAITIEPEFTKHYKYKYQYLNELIKTKIAKDIDAPFKLTSYVTRHSWASHARDAKVNLYAIQAGLGHESSRTTEVYLSEIDTTLSDEAFNVIENKLG